MGLGAIISSAVENVRAAQRAERGLQPRSWLIWQDPRFAWATCSRNRSAWKTEKPSPSCEELKASSRTELTCFYEPLIDEVAVGDEIVLADGLARLQATGKTADELHCLVVDGGRIRSRQGVNLPGTQLSIPALGVVDIENAVWATTQNVDYISLSFVRNATEVEQLKQVIADNQQQCPCRRQNRKERGAGSAGFDCQGRRCDHGRPG